MEGVIMDNLISIIVPVYNVEDYIKQCLDSILLQTYTNFEVIVVDDGSTDSSSEICDDFAKKDKRFNVIHKENGGVSKARNIALDNVNGSYVVFVDSDDVLPKDALKKMIDETIATNSEVSVLGWYDFKDEDKKIFECKKNKIILENENVLKSFLNDQYFTSVIWGKIYKSEIINNNRFDENIVIAEDFDFLYKVLKKVNRLSVNTFEIAYKYRVRETSAMRKKYNDKFENEVTLCEKVLLEIQNERPNIEKAAIRRYQRANLSCIDKYYKENFNIKNVKHLVKNIKKYNMNLKFKDYLKYILLTRCKILLKLIYRIKSKI